MSQTYVVSIPLHITGFWISIDDEDPLYSGSIGAGINLKPGIRLLSTDSRGIGIYSDKGLIKFKTLNDTFKFAKIEPFRSRLIDRDLLGLGFGLSAGYSMASLILSYLNYNRGFTFHELGRSVHVAEVLNKTGYGDISAMIAGGLELRRAPGAPGISIVDRIPVYRGVEFIVSIWGRLSTPEMLSKYGYGIRVVGPKIYRYFIESPSLERFLEASYRFSREVGMLTKEIEAIIRDSLKSYIGRGNILGFFKKKNLIVLCVEKGYGDEIKDILPPVWSPEVYTINYTGFEIVKYRDEGDSEGSSKI